MTSAFTTGRNVSRNQRRDCCDCPKQRAHERNKYEAGMSWDEIVRDAYSDHGAFEDGELL